MLAMSGSPSRLKIYDLRINGRILNPPLGNQSIKQTKSTGYDYTASGVNMLHIAEPSAENNKIKGIGVDLISTLLLPSTKFDSSTLG